MKHLQTAAAYLLGSLACITLAGACSLAADGVTAKRTVFVAVDVAAADAIGVYIAVRGSNR